MNIGADTPYSVNRLAQLALEAFDSNLPIHHLPARNEVYEVYADHGRARRLLHLVPKVSLEEGVSRMAAWARRVGNRKSQVLSRIELAVNLPPAWAALAQSE
jgi:UDP-glucose 4-epimerase